MDALRSMGGNRSFDASGGFFARTQLVSDTAASVATTAILAKRLVARHRARRDPQVEAGTALPPANPAPDGEESEYESDEYYDSGEDGSGEEYACEEGQEFDDEGFQLDSGDELEDEDGCVWVYSRTHDDWTCAADESDDDQEYELDEESEFYADFQAQMHPQGAAAPQVPPPAAPHGAGAESKLGASYGALQNPLGPRAPAAPDAAALAWQRNGGVNPAIVPAGTHGGHFMPPQYFVQHQQAQVAALFANNARARAGNVKAAGAAPPAPSPSARASPGTLKRQGTSAVSQASADVDVAQDVAQHTHPRWMTQGVFRPFPVASTPTGRHCYQWADECFLCSVCGDSRSSSVLAEFGPGISAYFKYIKWLTWVFVILSILHTPSMVLNALGPGSSLSTAVGDIGVHSLTLGNLGDSRNVTQIFIPGTTCGAEQCSMTKAQAAVLYAMLDVIGVVMLLIAYGWLRVFEAREQPFVDKDYITVDDYAIQVRPLPSTADDISLGRHFEKVTGHRVVEVNVARDEGRLVRLAETRGKLVRQLREIEEEGMAAITQGHVQGLLKRKQRITREAQKVNSAIAKEREKHVGVLADRARSGMPTLLRSDTGLKGRWKGRGRALAAYVVFETEAGRSKALQMYRGSNMCCLRACQKDSMRYRPALKAVVDGSKVSAGDGASTTCSFCIKSASGRFAISVTPAPDPSSIRWKNLGVTAGSRLCRRTLTSLLALMAIALSFGLLVWASYRQQQARETGGEAECPTDRAVPLAEAQSNLELKHCYCSSLSAREVVSDDFCRDWTRERSLAALVQGLSSASVVIVNLCLATLMKRLTQWEKHHSFDSQSVSLAVRLFASQFINTALVVLFINADWGLLGIPVVNVSQQFSDFETGWYISVGAGVILTMLLNVFSPHAFPLLRWGQKRCLTRVALGEPFCYCNATAMRWLCLCCCPRWCCSTANHELSSNLVKRQKTICCARLCSPFVPRHQDKLTQMFLGPEFRLSVRYAQLTNTVFVTLMYSSGMPVLLPIAAMSFLVSFWVDKYLFLRFYRKPPHYDTRMGMRMTGLLPYAILLHLGFAAWMYSNRAIFSSNEYIVEAAQTGALSVGGALQDATLSYSDRLSQVHVVPFVVLFFIIVLYMSASAALQQLGSFLGRCLSVATCGHCQAHADFLSQLAQNKETLTFQQATSVGADGRAPKMIGTPSYNILAQPQCQDAFALSSNFKRSGGHKHVGDVMFDELPEADTLVAEKREGRANARKGRTVAAQDVKRRLEAEARAKVKDRQVAAISVHQANAKKKNGKRRKR